MIRRRVWLSAAGGVAVISGWLSARGVWLGGTALLVIAAALVGRWWLARRRCGRATMRRALVIASAALLVACGSTATTTSRSQGSSTAPAVAGPTIVVEADVKTTVRRGTPAVLLFMAPGCASCAATANAMTSAVGDPRIRLIGVDLSTSDDAGTLRSFLSDAQLGSLPITRTIDRDGSLAQQYQVQAESATVGVAGGSVRFTNQ